MSRFPGRTIWGNWANKQSNWTQAGSADRWGSGIHEIRLDVPVPGRCPEPSMTDAAEVLHKVRAFVEAMLKRLPAEAH
jgi:hypothetical protein